MSMIEKHPQSTPLVYTFEIEIDLVKLDPKYPKDPKTLGEHIRKARMDRRIMVKELAERIDVVPETVINWEKHNLRPTPRHLERLREVLGLNAQAARSSHGDLRATVDDQGSDIGSSRRGVRGGSGLTRPDRQLSD